MSVYKDSKRGTYYVSYSYKDGLKFRHVTKRGFKSIKDAKEWERQSYFNRDGQAIPKLFSDIVKEWESQTQPSKETLSRHETIMKKRFSKFKDKPIKDISKADLIAWRSDLADSSYSTNTKNQTITFVKSIFKYASEAYDTPNAAAILKGFKKTNAEIMREMEVWTPEEFDRFLSMVSVREYRLYFEFLYWTGCRRGEALALQKADVHDGCAVIRYSQSYAKDGLKPTKTRQTRVVKLDKVTYDDIYPLKSEGSSPYLFTHRGKPLCIPQVRKAFNEAIEKSGVKKIRIHDLRHSHATWLINNGVNIVAVSKRLGHATIEQTLKTYTHLLTSTDQNMMAKIDAYRSI